jgi:hypothetical protein
MRSDARSLSPSMLRLSFSRIAAISGSAALAFFLAK